MNTNQDYKRRMSSLAAERFSVSNAPNYKDELYEKYNSVKQSRQFKHKQRMNKFNLVINNLVNSHSPLFQ